MFANSTSFNRISSNGDELGRTKQRECTKYDQTLSKPQMQLNKRSLVNILRKAKDQVAKWFNVTKPFPLKVFHFIASFVCVIVQDLGWQTHKKAETENH